MTTTTKHEWEARYVSVDRHGKEIEVGQRLKILLRRDEWRGFTLRLDSGGTKHISDPSEFDFNQKWPDGRGVMRGYNKHVDFEHGHEVWIEIVG
jgi:hypothetical protein